MSMGITVEGLDDVVAKLNRLASNTTARRLVERAGRAALKPVVADARAHCPKDTGTLRKSIGTKKAKRTAPGVLVLSVGARRGFDFKDEHGRNHDPFFYSIPVEYGHVTKGGGFVPPAGMFRGAYHRNRISVVDNFGSLLRDLVDAELAKP